MSQDKIILGSKAHKNWVCSSVGLLKMFVWNWMPLLIHSILGKNKRRGWGETRRHPCENFILFEKTEDRIWIGKVPLRAPPMCPKNEYISDDTIINKKHASIYYSQVLSACPNHPCFRAHHGLLQCIPFQVFLYNCCCPLLSSICA